jgi:hypothetical protein
MPWMPPAATNTSESSPTGMPLRSRSLVASALTSGGMPVVCT